MKNRFRFRIWNSKSKYFVSHEESMDYFAYMWEDGMEIYWDGNPDDDNKYIIQQWIGFKDKNGKEIFEGDIVRVARCHTISKEKSKGVYTTEVIEDGEEIGQIYWNNLSHRFVVSFEHIRYDDTEDLFCASGRYEVIGNIFENGDLVNEKI